MRKQDFRAEMESGAILSSSAHSHIYNSLYLKSDIVGGAVKRSIDIIVALLGIAATSPLLITIWCLVRLETKGPGFFKQERGGLNRQPFYIFKYRTMVEHGDEFKQAVKGDNRVTSLGKFLRKSSLDELPQLFNVLRGEMSLIGPRPHVLAHDEEFLDFDNRYLERFRARPGLTGLAQVSGSRGPTDTDEKKKLRIDLDLEYIEKWSAIADLQILLKTVFTVLGTGKGF